MRGGQLARAGPQERDHIGPGPVDRGRPGSKHHLTVEANGIPLQVRLSGGNRNDVAHELPLVGSNPPIRGLSGRPRRQPRELVTDRGYGHGKYRRLLHAHEITPRIARRGVAHGSGQGQRRWVVQRGFAWLLSCERLRTRGSVGPTSTSGSWNWPAD